MRTTKAIGGNAIWGLSVGFVILMLVMTAIEMKTSYDRTIEVAADNLADTARVTEEQTRGSLRVLRLTLAAIADEHRTSPDTLRAFLLSRVAVLPEIRQAFVADGRGIIIAASAPRLEGRDISEREFFTGARALPPERDIHLSKPLPIGLDDGAMLVFVSMPVRNPDGSLDGIVGISIRLDHFLSLLKSVHTGEPGAGALLVAPDGDIIGRDPEAEIYVGRNISKGGAFSMHRQSGLTASTHHHLTATDGKWKVSAVRTLTDPTLPPLVVIIGRPLDGVLAPWRAEAATHVLVIGALVLAVFALTALTSRHVRALRAGEERYRGLIETQQDMIVRLGTDGRMAFVNGAFARAQNRTAAELIGARWQDFVHPDDHRNTAKAIEQILLPPGFRASTENRVMTASGERWIAWEGSAIHDLAGSVSEIQAVGRDITDWVAHRESQKALLTELDRSNRELEQFAYVASHDMREPLRMIGSYIELLTRRYGDRFEGEARDFLDYARDGAKRMDQMILDLLEFSRVGRTDDEPAPVSLGDIVEEAQDILQFPMLDKAAEIVISSDLPTIMGRHGQLVRLFQNLISNALKYCPPERAPRIEIGAQPDGGHWLIRVADNGIGIDPEHHGRIFDIFQRLHTRAEYEGTGIGLALCRKIVERHGGRIWVESAPDQGAAFIFTLPAAKDQSARSGE